MRSTKPARNSPPWMVITIDGPAGVGKSTTAQLLAKRLRLTYLDTGATYRALAYAALRQGLRPIEDAKPLASLARRLPITLTRGPGGSLRVSLSGADVTRAIRTEEVTEAAAQISQHPEVRRAMVQRQRELANQHGVVVEGRDTGSVVFPQATHKFFLDADATIRARRRQQELGRFYGTPPSLALVREQLHFRDRIDQIRRVGPLVKPTGAVAINTSHLTARQVVSKMIRHIQLRDAGRSLDSGHSLKRGGPSFGIPPRRGRPTGATTPLQGGRAPRALP